MTGKSYPRVAAAITADLGQLEEGQQVVTQPAAAAELRPHVIGGGLAPHVEMAVDRVRAAYHLAAG